MGGGILELSLTEAEGTSVPPSVRFCQPGQNQCWQDHGTVEQVNGAENGMLLTL